MQALKYLDLFDAVLGKTKPGDYSSKGFLFYSGLGDHGLVYDVCGVSIFAKIASCALTPRLLVPCRARGC